MFVTAVLVGCCSALGFSPLFAMSVDVSRGCASVNTGALDVAATVNNSGLVAGSFGSGVVAGFREGDVLSFAVEAHSGSLPFRHLVRLTAIDRSAGETDTVFIPTEHVLAPGANWSQIGNTYAIPGHGAHWSLFTAGMAEGEGDYKVTVRCAPSSRSADNSLS